MFAVSLVQVISFSSNYWQFSLSLFPLQLIKSIFYDLIKHLFFFL